MKKILSIVAVVFVALVVIGVVAGKKDSPAAPAAAPEPSAGSSPAPAASVEASVSPAVSSAQSGMFIDFGDYTIEITDVKIIPAEENFFEKAPTIAFWYTVTNVSRDDISPAAAWVLAFDAFQDNDPNYLKELEIASLPDDAHLDTQDAKIKKGGSLENSAAYILTDLETPVLLKSSMFAPIEYEQEFPVK